MERSVAEKIIEAGNLAPSGSNSQPWRFIVKGDEIRIVALPKKDHRILNFRKRGTYVAHGALMENMRIAAKEFGYDAEFDAFPGGADHIDMTLRESPGSGTQELYPAIEKRHTNRRPYETRPLSEDEKRHLFSDLQKFPSCELALVEGDAIRPIAESLALDIALTLKHPLLHKLLFEEILWKEEHQKTRGGLYIKTMEVAPPKSTVFKMMGNWKAAQFFAKLKIPEKIYQENTETIASSALLGAIAVNDDDRAFVEAGRMVEDIWLRSATLGLGFQLVTGIVFLWQHANLGADKTLSAEERDAVDGAYERVRDGFGIRNGIIALGFRIGHAKPPTAVSHKRPPEIQWE